MLLGSPESAIFGSLGGKYSIWATVVSGAVLAWGPGVSKGGFITSGPAASQLETLEGLDLTLRQGL